MNRKGKKKPPSAAKNKASRPKSPSIKSHTLASAKNKSVTAAKKRSQTQNRQSLVNTLAQSNPKLKRNLAAKKKASVRANHSVSNNKQSSLKITKPKLSIWLAIYVLIITVGVSTLLGTTIAIATSFKTETSQSLTIIKQNKANNSANQTKLQQILTLSALGQEINPLKTKLETLAQKYPELSPQLFLIDLDTKGFVSIQGKERVASASTIKLPILVAFFQDLDQGKIRLEEELVMTKELMAGGSGDMQHGQPETKFSALETATKMIVISDNTATNMLIERLGGMSELNQRFLAMGLTNTQLNNLLPDLTGTNTTSPEDLASLLIKIDNGELLSLRSRDRLLYIMSNVEKDTLLPQGLEADALIAHKTGDIKSVLAVVGTIDMPNGKRYIASMLVKRPSNSPQAQEFIQQASGIAYQYFKNPQANSFKLESSKPEE